MKHFYPKFKIFTTIALFLVIVLQSYMGSAQTTLTPGDIAIIGVNHDKNPYELSIVTLAPIAANTQIYISDYWYNESTVNTLTNVQASSGNALGSEGAILWTPTAAITAGTVFKISITKGTNTVTGLPGIISVTGWTDPLLTATPSSAGGENWFIYQGTSVTNVTNFVFLWGNAFTPTINTVAIVPGQFVTPGSGNLSFNGVSYLPPSLTLGTNAIALTTVTYHGNNNKYKGIQIGTKAAILAEICDKSKWDVSETITYDIDAGGTTFSGVNPIFTVITSSAPTVTTTAASGVGAVRATLGGNVSADGGSAVTERGIVWATTANPTTANTKITNGTGTGNFSAAIASLPPATLVHFRAYAINSIGTSYGSNLTFTTNPALSASSGQSNVSCFGGSNGTATVSPSGGLAPYTYSWSPAGGTGATTSGLTAGAYTCTITDNEATQIVRNFTIIQPTAISVTPASQTNVSCFGGSNGAAAINTPTGGAGGYTYNWTPGTPTGDGTTSVTGLSAGTWTCTVTDANGCIRTQNFTITAPSAISVTPASQTNVSCFGGSNGAATINTPTGGAGGYTYNWTPGTPTGDGTTSVTGLSAGTWTCTVTDVNGCIATQNFTVTAPTAISVTPASQTNVSCFGGSNGAAAINTPTGGAGGYTYNWTPGTPTGDGTTSVTGLSAGTWTCTVTDVNGCFTTQNFTITAPTAISVTPASQTNVSCFGGSNGAAAINTPTGGAGGYTYNWTPGTPTGDGTTSVTGLSAGTWTCTVTDANGCIRTQNFTITAPSAISVTPASQTNVSCFGGSNGAAAINTPTGGASGYTYNWTPGTPTGDGTTSVTGLSAGTWTCTVTDANGCTATQNFTVTAPTAISVTPASQTNVSCFGGSNGAAAINTPTGGAGGYTYNWTPGTPTGDGTTSVTGLSAGTWTCTVTDANGCITTQNFTITQTTAISVTPSSQTNVACFGGSNGAAAINTPTGGAGGYTYNWTPGTPTGDGTTSVTGLSAGTWTCTVTDANGCITTQSFTVTQPTAISVTPASQTNVSCFGGSNGAAAINTPTGGAGGYTYNWTPGTPTGDGTTSVTGLSAGTWTCTVTDANGCTATQNFTVTAPTAISVTPASQTNVSCFGGSNGAAAINTPTGGAGGYTYNWTPGTPTGDGTTSVTGLSAGTWTCTITDANGCTATQNFTVTAPTAINTATGSQTNASCNGGSNGTASVTPTGGTAPYTYSWSPSGGTAATATGLSAGIYTVTVTDANGCTATRTFTITEPTAIDQTVTLVGNTLTANQSGASYQWYNCADNSPVGTNSNTFTPTQSGDYNVVITIGTCSATSVCTTTLGTDNFERDAFLTIYPNPSQGIINIKSSSDGDFQVWNQLGQLVKTFKVELDIIKTIDLQNLSDGIYFIKEVNHSKTYKIIVKQ